MLSTYTQQTGKGTGHTLNIRKLHQQQLKPEAGRRPQLCTNWYTKVYNTWTHVSVVYLCVPVGFLYQLNCSFIHSFISLSQIIS